MKSILSTSLLSAACGLVTAFGLGCAAESIDEPELEGDDLAQSKADQINGNDDPSGLLGAAERRLASLVTKDDVGESFGVPEASIPYPDTYWPMVDNGIAVEWLEQSGTRCGSENNCSNPQPSPLHKLMNIINPSRADDAFAWEVKNHGKDVPNVASWFGHCPGWVATAMLYDPIPAPIWVRGNGLGLEKCEDNDASCTKFEIGDINALGAEVHEGAFSRFIGARCDTEPSEIKRDEHGRVIRNGRGCKGLNAGALLIVMGNRLKLEQKPFAIDAQNEFTTEQIWNQPAFRYTVNRFEGLTETEAANLVASAGDSRTGDQTSYPWNNQANGFAFIDFTLHWVTETSGPNLKVVAGASSAKSTRMVAVIELDRPFSDPNANITGGEYLDDSSVGADRLRVAPFAWIALDAGPDFRHNPFIKTAAVKELLTMALADDGPTEPTTCEHSLCETGDKLVGDCDDCAADICEADPFCCNNSWDQLCVNQVSTVCSQTCD